MNAANWRLAAALASLLAGWNWLALEAEPAGHSTVTPSIDTVLVAAPTGERDTDRASILASLAQVRPGGTVQFAAGTYLMGGEIIRVTVPRITLLGHAEGTTLRGCDPGEFPWDDVTEFGNNCNAIELAAGQQTVRNLTFEHAFWALHVGCCWDSHEKRGVDGGHLVEGNTFRSSSNGVRVHGFWSEPTVIRNNTLLNNWHSVQIYGGTVHLLDNNISVPEPEKVQLLGFPMEGVHLASPFELHESVQGAGRTCENNVIAGNRIDGVTEGIMVTAIEPGIICRNNVIRDNTIIVRRARPPAMPGFIAVSDPGDSTVIGVPLALRGVAGERTLEDNLIEGNVIVGAEGLGIEIRNAFRNRIVNNTVTGVVRREPFPGNSFVAMPLIGGDPEAWRSANGAGIWLSPGSEGNDVAGNVFDSIAGPSVVREGALETDDGVRLYYRIEGEGRDTVVVVHGGPSLGHGYLAPDLVPLTRGRAVVHYDQRGIGQSTPLTDPERLTVEQHVQDLEALRVHLGLDGLALLGHSWGGMLAARYAAAHPQRVERILLLDPMAPAREPFMAMSNPRVQEMVSTRMDDAARARLDSLVSVAEVDDDGAHCRALFSLLTRIYFETPAATSRTRADFCAGSPETLRNREAVDAAILGSLGEWDVRHLLRQVSSPVLVVHGAASAIPQEAMEAWVEALPNARLITIDGGGHYLHVDRPEAFFPAAATFLDGGWPEDDAVELAIRLDAYSAQVNRNPPAADNHPAPADSVDAFILGRMAELGIPGVSVAVLRGNEVLKLASYGRANLELDVPASSTTLFPYASITKAFTGTAMLRLVERNLLALDDRVGELLPGLPATWSAVTVRQLLSHTSGLPDVARMEEAISNPLVLRDMLFASTRDSALELLPSMPLSFEAARSVAYNQTNYMLLAMLLERLDGRTIEVFVREEFAQPLGLTSLVFGDSRAIMPGRASWYTRIDYSTGRPEIVPVQPLWLEYPSFLYTTAGLNGSALDLARFVAAVASGDLLSEASRGEMWGNAQLADGSVARMGPYGVALGWLTDDRAGRSVWMGGAESGAVRYFIDEDLTVAVLTNLMGAGPYDLVDGAAKAYLADEVATRRAH